MFKKLFDQAEVKFVKYNYMRKKMSLTREQQEELEKLGTYFENIEKLAVKNGIDLDVFITEYKADGYAVYATENVEIKEALAKRKRVFEKAGKEKQTIKAARQ